MLHNKINDRHFFFNFFSQAKKLCGSDGSSLPSLSLHVAISSRLGNLLKELESLNFNPSFTKLISNSPFLSTLLQSRTQWDGPSLLHNLNLGTAFSILQLIIFLRTFLPFMICYFLGSCWSSSGTNSTRPFWNPVTIFAIAWM